MIMSVFRFYSVGVAAEDKEKDSHELRILPIEILPDVTGELQSLVNTVEVSGKDASDVEYTVKIKASSTIKATWMPIGGGNQVTSPDVIRGEKIIIMQLGDTDKFYWCPLGNTNNLRRLETVVYAWAAEPDPEKELDLDTNMYRLEISTDMKLIRFTTSNANEEPYTYEFKLDTNEGNFTFTDNEGNLVYLDSKERIIKAINSDETEATIEKTNMYAYAKDLMEFKCDGEVKGTVEKKVDITCNGEYIARAPKMQFGKDDAVQPSVLGNNHATAHEDLELQINNSQVIGNLGIPTSTISAVKPVTVPNLNSGGNSYSTVNKNQ